MAPVTIMPPLNPRASLLQILQKMTVETVAVTARMEDLATYLSLARPLKMSQAQ
jgi:hypothetical protein